MDYEKKYKEALEWAKKVMQGKVGFVLDEVLEKFPELKESDDERIREEMMEYCYKRMNNEFPSITIHQVKRWAAWLEKQNHDGKKWIYEDVYLKEKEQLIQDGIDEVLENPQKYGLEKQGEQKLNWSEEDEMMLEAVMGRIGDYGTGNMQKDWLKSIKDRVQPQQEWREEDEKIIDIIISDLERHGGKESSCYSAEINWLKSLKDRVRIQQNEWQPSDEQMQALSNAGNSFRPFEEGHKVLWSLYNDLKKLREV